MDEPAFLVTPSMVRYDSSVLLSGRPAVTPEVATPIFDAVWPMSLRSMSVNPSEIAAVRGTDDPVVSVASVRSTGPGGGANSGASLRPATLMVTVWVSKAPCSSVTWMSKVSNTTSPCDSASTFAWPLARKYVQLPFWLSDSEPYWPFSMVGTTLSPATNWARV